MPKNVIVIGGGIIGCTTAFYLNREGHRVTLVEKDEIGKGASHGNCGLILPHIIPVNAPGIPWLALKWLFKPMAPLRLNPLTLAQAPGWFFRFVKNCTVKSMMTAAQALAPMLANAAKEFDDFIQENAINCEWKYEGLFNLYKTNDSLQTHRADVDIERKYGIESDLISYQQIKEKVPDLINRFAGAWFYPNAGHLRPDLFLRELKKILVSKGVRIKEHTSFQSFISSGNSISAVSLNNGIYPCDFAVLATGAWSSLYQKQLCQRLAIQPGKGYSLTFNNSRSINHPACIFVDQKVVYTPMGKSFRLGGTMEFGGFDNSLNRARLDALKTVISSFHRTEPTAIQEEWCGWRPMTVDGLPYIDFLPNLKNVIMAAGHNMVGFSMALSTGKLVTDFIKKETATLNPNPFGFQRSSLK